MTSLHPAPAAFNAASQPVRTAPTRDAISFPASLTDQMFERWLDLYPGRRQGHERRTPAEQLQVRERVARMYALRGSQVSQAYATALSAADQLHDALETILQLYGPKEAERVLRDAGLRVPHVHDIEQAYGSHTFEQQHGDCKRMKRRVDEFIESLHQLCYILPGEDPDESRNRLATSTNVG